MRKVIDQTLQLRKGFYQILKTTPREKLLNIPKGFNNNIWWNIAHVVVTEQLLVYKMSGLNVEIPNSLVEKFRKGTVPDGTASDEEIELVKSLLFTTIEKTQVDYDNGIFKNFNEYTTSANITLRNVEDAIAFNNFHEGLHLGTILSLQKL